MFVHNNQGILFYINICTYFCIFCWVPFWIVFTFPLLLIFPSLLYLFSFYCPFCYFFYLYFLILFLYRLPIPHYPLTFTISSAHVYYYSLFRSSWLCFSCLSLDSLCYPHPIYPPLLAMAQFQFYLIVLDPLHYLPSQSLAKLLHQPLCSQLIQPDLYLQISLPIYFLFYLFYLHFHLLFSLFSSSHSHIISCSYHHDWFMFPYCSFLFQLTYVSILRLHSSLL